MFRDKIGFLVNTDCMETTNFGQITGTFSPVSCLYKQLVIAVPKGGARTLEMDRCENVYSEPGIHQFLISSWQAFFPSKFLSI